MKPSNVLLQGCSVKLGPAVLLLPQDCAGKQCRSGASRLRPWEFVLVMYSLPQGSAGFAQNRSGCSPATLLFKIRHWLRRNKPQWMGQHFALVGMDPVEATMCPFCRSTPTGPTQGQKAGSLKARSVS